LATQSNPPKTKGATPKNNVEKLSIPFLKNMKVFSPPMIINPQPISFAKNKFIMSSPLGET
jgi:hypothetical protein